MTKVTLDTKGAGFHTVDEDGDRAYTEPMVLFLKTVIALAHALFDSKAGGCLSITIPTGRTTAEVDLEMGPVPAEAKIEDAHDTNQCHTEVHDEPATEPHDGASAIGQSEVASGLEIFARASLTGL